jgi:intracellular sulfur oxidation DsrE/DsrF family protein
MNTMKKVTKNLGHEPKLDPVAQHVDAGVVQIVDLVHQGYVLIKP